jgi:hypothetical protein
VGGRHAAGDARGLTGYSCAMAQYHGEEIKDDDQKGELIDALRTH